MSYDKTLDDWQYRIESLGDHYRIHYQNNKLGVSGYFKSELSTEMSILREFWGIERRSIKVNKRIQGQYIYYYFT